MNLTILPQTTPNLIACTKHFAVDSSMHCDVLAGEQGPPSHSTKQIPDFKVIYVRFIQSNVVDVDEVEGISISNEDDVGAKKKETKMRD